MRETTVLLQWGRRLGPSCDGDGMARLPKGEFSAIMRVSTDDIVLLPRSLDGIIDTVPQPIELILLVLSSSPLGNV